MNLNALENRKDEVRLAFNEAAGVHFLALVLLTMCVWVKNSTAGRLVALWLAWGFGFFLSEFTLINDRYNSWWFLIKGGAFASFYIITNTLWDRRKEGPKHILWVVRPLWDNITFVKVFLGIILFGACGHSLLPFLDRPGFYSHEHTAESRASNRIQLRECQKSLEAAKSESLPTISDLEKRVMYLQNIESRYVKGQIVDSLDANWHPMDERNMSQELKDEIKAVKAQTNSIDPTSVYKWFYFKPKTR